MNEMQFAFLSIWLTGQTALLGFALWRLGNALDELHTLKSDVYRIVKRVG